MKSAPALLSAVTAPSTLWAAPFFPPLLNSNWKALLSPACLYQHGQGSRRLKPRLKTKELLQSNPQSSLVVVATSLSAYLWNLGRSAHWITSGQSHSASNHPEAISCQVQHSNFEIKLQEWGAVLPLGQELFSLKSRGSCPLPQGPAKERAGTLSLPPQISAIKFQPTSVMTKWIFPSQFFPPVEMGVNLTCQF